MSTYFSIGKYIKKEKYINTLTSFSLDYIKWEKPFAETQWCNCLYFLLTIGTLMMQTTAYHLQFFPLTKSRNYFMKSIHKSFS